VLLQLAGNKTLALLARLLDNVVRRQAVTVNKDAAHDPLREAALDEHEELVDLIEAQRDAEAEAHWRAHIDTNARNLLSASAPDTVLDLYTVHARPEWRLQL